MTKRKRESNTPKPAAPVEPEACDEQQPSDFFAQLQHLNPEDWQGGHKVYIHRIWPVIDKRDDQHYVAKLSEPFDEEVILRNWGSGKYLLKLNNGRGESVASRTVSLHNPAFPPKVSPDEVVQTDPRNERYFKAWPVAPAPTPAPADSAAVHELSKLATRVLEKRDNEAANENAPPTLTSMLVKWALEQTSKDRDGGDPARIAALLKELKALLPQQQPADGLATVDRVLSIVEKLNTARPKTETQNPLEYVDKILSLADKLRPAQSAPVTATGDGGNLAAVAAIVHEAADLLKNPLTIAAQVWAASKARNAATTPIPPSQATAAYPNSAQPQSAQSGAAAPAPAAAPPPQDIVAIANAITPVMLKWLHEDAPGGELGASFAEWVADGWGFEDLKSLQGVGGAGILELYRQSPVWIVLAPMEAKFQQFLEAFVTWQPDDDTGDGSRKASEAHVIDLDAA